MTWLHKCSRCGDGFARREDLVTHEEACRAKPRPSRRPNAKERRQQLHADDITRFFEGAPER